MGVKCQILLNNRNRSYYKSGDTVEGKIKLVIDKLTEIQSVTLSLIGNVQCQFKKLIFYPGVTHIGTDKKIYQSIVLLKAEDYEMVTLEAGEYEDSFSFELPDKIPSTYIDDICFIKYNIVLEFNESKNYVRVSKKFNTEIKVIGDVQKRENGSLLTKNVECTILNSRRICLNVQAAIEKTYVTAGESIRLNMIFRNLSKVPITAVITELVMYTTYLSNGNTKLRKVKSLQDTVRNYPIIKENFGMGMSLLLPTPPDLFSVHNCKIFRKDFKLKVTAKFPFPYFNTTFKILVVIEEKCDSKDEALADVEPVSCWQDMREGDGNSKIKMGVDNVVNIEDEGFK